MQERLLVLPNPYTFVDGDGEPQGACPADPGHAAGKRMWVGAKLDTKRTQFGEDWKDRRKGLKWKGDPRPHPQVTKFAFAAKPVEIPSTPHYLDRIREGSLVAANEQTFGKAFGARVKYRAPEHVLAEARARAFDQFQAAYGQPPAFARVEQAAPAEPQPVPAEQPKDGDMRPGRKALQDLARSSADTAPAEAPGGTT